MVSPGHGRHMLRKRNMGRTPILKPVLHPLLGAENHQIDDLKGCTRWIETGHIFSMRADPAGR